MRGITRVASWRLQVCHVCPRTHKKYFKNENKRNKPGGDDGSRALLNNATTGTIELVEAFEEALP